VSQHLVLRRGQEELVLCHEPVDVCQFGLGVGVFPRRIGDGHLVTLASDQQCQRGQRGHDAQDPKPTRHPAPTVEPPPSLAQPASPHV
jgi:hypothetical protein